MKRFLSKCFWILIMVSLAGCFFGPSLAFYDKDTIGKPNLVLNPDFENSLVPGEKYPDNWMFISTMDYKEIISWDSSTAQSGTKSMKIENPSQQLLLVSDSFPIEYRGVYLDRCYVKSLKPAKVPVVISFRTFDQRGTRKDNIMSKLLSTTEWQELMLTAAFFKPTAQFARIIISIPLDPENTYWIDNAGSFKVHTLSR